MSLMLSSLLGGGARGLMAGEEARRQQDRESLSYFATLSELVEKGRMTNAEALQRYKEWTGYEPDRRRLITRTQINDWEDVPKPQPPAPPLIQAPPFPSQPDLSQQMGWMEPKSYPRSPLFEAATPMKAKRGPVGQEPLAGKWPYNDRLDRKPKVFGPVDTRRVPPLGPWDLSNPEAIRYRDTDPLTQGIMHLPEAGKPDPRNYGIPDGKMQPWPKQPIPFEQREKQSVPPSKPLTTYQPPDPKYEFPRLVPRVETREQTEEINPFTAKKEIKLTPYTDKSGLGYMDENNNFRSVVKPGGGGDGTATVAYTPVLVSKPTLVINTDGSRTVAQPGHRIMVQDPTKAAELQKAVDAQDQPAIQIGPRDYLTDGNAIKFRSANTNPARWRIQGPDWMIDPKTGKKEAWLFGWTDAGDGKKPIRRLSPAEIADWQQGKLTWHSFDSFGTRGSQIVGQTPRRPEKPPAGKRRYDEKTNRYINPDGSDAGPGPEHLEPGNRGKGGSKGKPDKNPLKTYDEQYEAWEDLRDSGRIPRTYPPPVAPDGNRYNPDGSLWKAPVKVQPKGGKKQSVKPPSGNGGKQAVKPRPKTRTQTAPPVATGGPRQPQGGNRGTFPGVPAEAMPDGGFPSPPPGIRPYTAEYWEWYKREAKAGRIIDPDEPPARKPKQVIQPPPSQRRKGKPKAPSGASKLRDRARQNGLLRSN